MSGGLTSLLSNRAGHMAAESGSMFETMLTVIGSVSAVVHVIGRIQYPLHPLILCAKPVPILCLAILLQSWSKGVADTAGYTKWLRRGLFLSMAGDIFLMPVQPFDKFIAGLASFLAAHLCYIIAFLSEQTGFARPACNLKQSDDKDVAAFAAGMEDAARRVRTTSTAFAVPFVVFAGVIYGGMLHDHLPVELVGPVIAYVAAIGTMGWRSASRFGPGYLAVPPESYTNALCGSMLFLISDALLGMGKFNPAFTDFQAVVDTGVMVTYYGGQYFIARSCTLGPVVTWGEDGRPIGASASEQSTMLSKKLLEAKKVQ